MAQEKRLLISNNNGSLSLADLARTAVSRYSGSLYLPNDSTCFQDSAGTTPATKDSVVGLMIDQGQGGLGALGAERWLSGLSSTGWTTSGVTVSSDINGNLAMSFAATNSYAYKGFSCAQNTWYKLTFEVEGAQALNYYVSTSGVTGNIAAAVSKSASSVQVIFNSGANATLVLGVSKYAGAGSSTFSGISVREVPGIHATQATTGYKPILRKGAKNLLKSSEAYDPACWGEFSSGSATISTNPEVGAPDGISSSVKYAPNDDGLMYFGPFLNQTAGVTYTATYYVRIDSGTLSANLRITNAPVTLSSTWQKFTETFTAASTTVRQYGVYLGSTSVPIYIVAQIEEGSTASTYVATTSAPASNGIGPWWLDFDGSDDHLIPSSGFGFAANDCFVSASLTRNSPGTGSLSVCGDGSGVSTSYVGWGAILRGNNAPIYTPQFLASSASVTSSTVTAETNTVPQGATKVVSWKRNAIRVNAVSQTVSGDATGIDVTASTPRIGCFYTFQNSQHFGGAIYGLALAVANPTDAELSTIERYLASLAGVTI